MRTRFDGGDLLRSEGHHSVYPHGNAPVWKHRLIECDLAISWRKLVCVREGLIEEAYRKNVVHFEDGRLPMIVDVEFNPQRLRVSKIEEAVRFDGNIPPELTLGGNPHVRESLPRGNGSTYRSDEARTDSPKTQRRSICHKLLGADVSVFVLLASLLILIGWVEALVSKRPLAGAIIILLGVVTLTINKREVARTFCDGGGEYQATHDHRENNHSELEIFDPRPLRTLVPFET